MPFSASVTAAETLLRRWVVMGVQLAVSALALLSFWPRVGLLGWPGTRVTRSAAIVCWSSGSGEFSPSHGRPVLEAAFTRSEGFDRYWLLGGSGAQRASAILCSSGGGRLEAQSSLAATAPGVWVRADAAHGRDSGIGLHATWPGGGD